jgi:hypothetical protein
MRGPTFFVFDPTQRNTCAPLMGAGFRRSLSRTSGKRMTMVQATDSDTTTPTTCARSLVRRPNRRRALTHGSRSRPARPARSDIARSASVTPNATLTGQTGNPEDREGQDRRRAQDSRARLGPIRYLATLISAGDQDVLRYSSSSSPRSSIRPQSSCCSRRHTDRGLRSPRYSLRRLVALGDEPA